MDRGRKERKLKGDKQGISYAETPEKISKLPKGDRADKLESFSTHYERIKGEFGYEQSGVLVESIISLPKKEAI